MPISYCLCRASRCNRSKRFVVRISDRCASGKSTLRYAKVLSKSTRKAARVKKLILFSLIILLTFVSLSPSPVLAQGDNDDSEWRKRKGEKEIDTSGSVSLNNGTSFEFSGSFGLYIANYVQMGMEGSFEYEETEE